MANKQLSCEERIGAQLESTIDTLRKLWAVETNDVKSLLSDEDLEENPDAEVELEEQIRDELGEFYEYGLSFDYVAPETFGEDQEKGYFRYQLSWGGPSDEFRFYTGPEFRPYNIEYWFLDWFDGASRTLYDDKEELLENIFYWFSDCLDLNQMVEEASESY